MNLHDSILVALVQRAEIGHLTLDEVKDMAAGLTEVLVPTVGLARLKAERPEILGIAMGGKKIHAIKEARGHLGLSLKEAKDMIEAWMAEQPPVPSPEFW